MNRTLTIISFALLATTALCAGCSVNPCDDLTAYAAGCTDPDVVAVIDRVLAAGDKDTCRMYRDAWGYTFAPRCFYMPDAGDAGDAGDSGEAVDGSADAGIDGGYDASLDAQQTPDGMPPYDAGDLDAAVDGSPADSGGIDASPDGGAGDSGGTDASSD